MKTKYNRCLTTVTIKFGNADIVSKKLITEYIKESILSWQGCYHPDHPLRNNIKQVSVKRIIGF